MSRGGAILTRWMYVNKKENPFYENFDKIRELVDEMVTGEILVADTTAPEIMSACKKA